MTAQKNRVIARELLSQLLHFPENLARLFIAQQGGAFRGVDVRAEKFALDYAEQAADGGSHGIDGTLFGFGVTQWAGVYPLLQVILHLLFEGAWNAPACSTWRQLDQQSGDHCGLQHTN